MCNAIPLAALLTALLAGLTLLRCTRGGSPNAQLMTKALTLIEGPAPTRDDAPAPNSRPTHTCQPDRDATPCAT